MKNWPAPVETPAPPAGRPHAPRGSILATAFGTALALVALSFFSGSHIVFALVAIPIVVMMAWTNPEAMLGVLPIWMVLMGFVRRITPGGGNVTFSGDPVLIIGPIALLVLTVLVVTRRQGGTMSTLARCVLTFNVLAFIEAFNPLQGSLLTGVGGLLFIFIPTTAFWVGRHYGGVEFFERIIWTVAVMGLLAASYGLYQQFVGFPSWDQRYIDTKAYTALNVGGGVVRAFSFFSSAEEYAVFLSVAAVAWVALLSKRTRWPIVLHLAAIFVVIDALFYESQRTSFFLLVLALGVMAASRLRLRPVNVLLAGATAIALLIVFAGALGGGGSGSSSLANQQSASQVLANHQTSGLSNPTGPGSTLKGHIHETYLGIKEGLRDPFGHGTGSVNLAATHYTKNNKNHGTEFDIGNMGIAFGVPGMIIYALLVFFALRTAYRLSIRRRDATGLFVIGIVAATIFQWTNGDLYSVCWLIWLSLGVADSLVDLGPTPTASPEPEVPTPFAWRRPGEPSRAIERW